MERSRRHSPEVNGRLTPTAPWGRRLVRVGRGQGSLCWSRWARWLDAADRGSEAGRWREGRLERVEARGKVPCYRRVGSTWFQPDSAPPDAVQSPAGSKHTWQRSECCMLWGLVLQPPYGAYGGLRVIKSAAHQRIICKMLLNVHIKESSGHKVGHCYCSGCVYGLSEHHWEHCCQNNAPNDALRAFRNIMTRPTSYSNINILVLERHKLNGAKALMANWSAFGCITWWLGGNETPQQHRPVI